jgi:hypothetical protein
MKPGYKQFKMWIKPSTFEWLWNEKKRLNENMLAAKMKSSLGKAKALTDLEEVYIGDIIDEMIKAIQIANNDTQFNEVKQ